MDVRTVSRSAADGLQGTAGEVKIADCAAKGFDGQGAAHFQGARIQIDGCHGTTALAQIHE